MIRSIKELSIIIPAYNEFNNLKHLIKKTNSILLKNKNVEIIIVDNGSTDGSKNYLQYNKKLFSKIKFVRVKKNFGYGYGIKYGLKFATGKIISWTHADLQFDINDIIKFFQKNNNLIINQNLVIKGRRQNRTFLDVFFTNGMSIIVNFIFNTKLKDINGQPKMFNRKLIKNILKLGPNDFSIDLFLLLLALKNNLIINEFPLKVKNRVNDKAKGGGSFFGKIKLTFNTLRYIFILFFSLKKQIWKL
jgi:glycosyltransferase involved in cell wall biosynthesis|tara:strand:+ start:484 stop:1224 length:741 start_codon:yes stop_codon:yes gene_type:complete